MEEAFWQLIQHPYTEWVIMGLNFAFLFLLILEKMLCWPFGIAASVLSVLVFLSPEVKLYSEALLYSVYVVLGFYAWSTWQLSSTKGKMPIQRLSFNAHLKYILVGLVSWGLLGLFFYKLTDSAMPWADAFSTSFAFIATYLEAKKVLRTWNYWIVLNAFSIWLYQTRDLHVMALMMIGFTLFSVVGLLQWRKSYSRQTISSVD